MKKIAILGGSFNPVHFEHVNLAKQAISELNLDKLIVVPTFIPPHKSTLLAPAEDRLEMLRLAFDGIDKVEISDFEIQNQGKSYTYITVEHFKSVYDADLYFICGADMLIDFKTWRHPDRILKACKLAVFHRTDVSVDYEKEREYLKENYGVGFTKLSYVGGTDSSTKIRIYNSLGVSLKGLTDQKVIEYIQKNSLYLGDAITAFVKNNLPEKRLKHTADVTIKALSKTKELGLDSEKVRLACILHDIAKYVEPNSIKGFNLDENMPTPVVHAFLGAYIAENILKINDGEIIDAIRYHTSGKENMSLLSKLVFVADMIEDGRNYEGVSELRKAFEGDFENCFRKCLEEEYIHLQNKKTDIYFETEKAYNYYIKGKN